MAKFKLYDQQAKEVGEIELANEVFKAEYNPALINEVVVAYRAAQRQGTKSTLGRDEVRGGKKKPHKQKHTGMARQGSLNAPHQYGGGVAFAPKPRDFTKKINKTAKRVALASAISQKLIDGNMMFVKELKVAEKLNKEGVIEKHAKTKDVVKILDAFKAERTTLLVLDKNDVAVRRAARNIENVETTTAKQLNVYEVARFNKVIVTEAGARQIEEGLR